MLKILLVDDERLVRDGVKLLLSKKAYDLEILEAENGREAETLLQTVHVDILFTDVEMPLMNGIQLSERARTIQPDIKIVFFSAHDDFEYAKSAINLHAVTYIVKPIQPGEFYDTMDRVIQLCHKEEEEKARAEKLETLDKMLSGREIEQYLTDLFFHGEFDENSIHPPHDLLSGDSDKELQMFFIWANLPVLSHRRKELNELLKKISPVPINLYIISGCYGVVTLELSSSGKFLFSRESWWRAFRSGVQNEIKGIVMLVIGTKRVSNLADIAREMNHVRHLLDLHFYIQESTLIWTEDAGTSPSTSINTDTIIEDIHRSIANGEYDKLSGKLSAFLNALSVNHECSSIYVKYLLFDIVNSIEKRIGEDFSDAASQAKAVLSESSNLARAEEAVQKMLNSLEEIQDQKSQHKNHYIRKILSIVHHDYASDISLDSLAQRVNLSVPYMSNLFKKEMGQSIGQYIKHIRMEKAKELLSNTDMRLNEIYPLVGYSSLTYFCICFKETYGVTPTQFRNKDDA